MKCYMILKYLDIMIKNQMHKHFKFMFFQHYVHKHHMNIIIYFIMFNLVFILIIVKLIIYYQ